MLTVRRGEEVVVVDDDGDDDDDDSKEGRTNESTEKGRRRRRRRRRRKGIGDGNDDDDDFDRTNIYLLYVGLSKRATVPYRTTASRREGREGGEVTATFQCGGGLPAGCLAGCCFPCCLAFFALCFLLLRRRSSTIVVGAFLSLLPQRIVNSRVSEGAKTRVRSIQ